MHWFGLVLMGFLFNLAGQWLSARTRMPLLREIVSSEGFLFLWLCVQASFVQRLKPERAILFTTLSAGLLLLVASLLYRPQGFTLRDTLPGVIGSVMLLVDLFRMRRALEDHYNGPEPYGLHLNGFLLFFLGPLYLQFHLLKIAQWKDRKS